MGPGVGIRPGRGVTLGYWRRRPKFAAKSAPRHDRRKGEGPRHTGQLACDLDVKLRFRMDAAEHGKQTTRKEPSTGKPMSIVSPGSWAPESEVERGVEYPLKPRSQSLAPHARRLRP